MSKILKTIAVLGQKGGSGKSTTTINLAVAGMLAGELVTGLDIDPQCSLSVWGDIRASEVPDDQDIDIEVLAIPPSRLTHGLKQAEKDGATLILIDSAPHNSEGILVAARAADLCLVPCRPSLLDLAAIATTLDLCSVAGAKVGLMINAIKTKRQWFDTRAALDDLVEADPDKRFLCPIPMGDRAVYGRSINDGLGVLEADKTSKAAAEIKQIYKWVSEHLLS